jgi:aldehyde dehydrogenase
VLNIVNGYGREAGMPLATSKRIAKIAFTGSTSHRPRDCAGRRQQPDPGHAGAGRQEPQHLLCRRHGQGRCFLDKAIEGLVLFAFNQGEVCTCPSRALIQESIYDKFMERVLKRVAAIKQGNPLDTDSMMGAQASKEQLTKILSYLDLGKQEGAEVLIGGGRPTWAATWKAATTCSPRCSRATTRCASSRKKSSAPVLAVTTFKDEAEALAIANDTLYGLGAGVWSRNGNVAYRMGRAIKAGRVWTNCYHAYPAHAAFGGYKESGIGRETHKMMLDHYQQTKNLLVSYSENKLGLQAAGLV